MQAKRVQAGGAGEAAAPPIVNQVLRSPGQPLSAATRIFMEPRFGQDFGHVRVYTDAKAQESARAVNSLAYTVGHNIVFAEGQYRPGGKEGRKLLAHELTHTIQQSAFASAAVPSHQPIGIEPPGTSLEQAAEERSTRLTNSSRPLAPIQRIAVQRKPAPPAATGKAGESGGESTFTVFVADERKRRDQRFARREAQADTARIRKAGTLSSEDRQVVNAKLRFFEGEAWKAYGQEVKPALVEVTRKEVEMPGEVTDGGGQPTPGGAKADPDAEQRRRENEGMAAYYKYTREAQLESAAASRAKFRENVHNMTAQEIDSQWEAKKEELISIASSPGHRLQVQALHWIWLKYWADRYKTASATIDRTQKREAATDADAYRRKMWEFHEDNKRDAFGPEYQAAESEVAIADLMFRNSVDANEILRTAEDQGKELTLQQLDKLVVGNAEFMDPWIHIAEAFAFASTGGPRATSLAEAKLAEKGWPEGPRPEDPISPGKPTPDTAPSSTPPEPPIQQPKVPPPEPAPAVTAPKRPIGFQQPKAPPAAPAPAVTAPKRPIGFQQPKVPPPEPAPAVTAPKRPIGFQQPKVPPPEPAPAVTAPKRPIGFQQPKAPPAAPAPAVTAPKRPIGFQQPKAPPAAPVHTDSAPPLSPHVIEPSPARGPAPTEPPVATKMPPAKVVPSSPGGKGVGGGAPHVQDAPPEPVRAVAGDRPPKAPAATPKTTPAAKKPGDSAAHQDPTLETAGPDAEEMATAKRPPRGKKPAKETKAQETKAPAGEVTAPSENQSAAKAEKTALRKRLEGVQKQKAAQQYKNDRIKKEIEQNKQKIEQLREKVKASQGNARARAVEKLQAALKETPELTRELNSELDNLTALNQAEDALQSSLKLERPGLREPTKAAVLKAAKNRTRDGRYVDPDGKIRNPPYVFGHEKGFENRRLIYRGGLQGMTQAEFNDWVNNHPEWFRIESDWYNSRHLGEKPGID